jgi:hypothetical protein
MSDQGVKVRLEADVDQAAREIEAFSKRSRTALTSLSLVVQDLPYGFIGIQNNLPAVIQTFGELATKSNGVGGALKELGKAMIGPGGLFFAFSALTSGVTFLVQKYGSLGAAFDALFGKTSAYINIIKDAEQAQKEFEKSVRSTSEIQNEASGNYAASAIKIQALSNIVLDATKSDILRKNALEQLKELDKDRFKNFNLEKTSLEGLTTAVDLYTQALIANAVAKEYEQEIGKTTINLNNQRDALFKLQQQFDNLNSTYPDLAAKAARYLEVEKERAKLVSTAMAPVKVFTTIDNQEFTSKEKKLINDYNFLKNKLEVQNKLVMGVEFPRSEDLRKKYEEAINLLNEFYQPGGKSGKAVKIKFDFELPKTEDYLKFVEKFYTPESAITRLSKFGDVLLDVNAKEKDRTDILNKLNLESQKVLGTNANYFDNLIIGVSSYDDLKNAVVQYGYALQQAVLDQQKLFDAQQQIKSPTFSIKDIKRGLFGDIEAAISNPDIEKAFNDFKERAKSVGYDALPSLKEFQEKLKEILTLETFKNDIPLVWSQITAIIKSSLNEIDTELTQLELDKQLKEQFANYYDLLDDLANQTKRTYEDIRSYVSEVLTKPLDYLVSTILEKGKVTWKEFADIAVESLKRIAKQVAINAIISAIANALAPGAGSLIGDLRKFKTGSLDEYLKSTSFLDAFGNQAVNFGGVNGTGGLGGEVVFVQRGSDLVGVLNRTNTNINRIG